MNGVAGNFILDTGATFVSITSQFARKANVATEPGNQVIMKTVGGKAIAEIGYANSVSVGKAEALGVVTAVHRDDSNPFGNTCRRFTWNELSFEVQHKTVPNGD